jgi:hypothetical protein
MDKITQDEGVLKENYAFYLTQKSGLLADPARAGKFAVVHDKKIHDFFDTHEAAYIWAKMNFSDENFLIQEIIDESQLSHFIWELECR